MREIKITPKPKYTLKIKKLKKMKMIMQQQNEMQTHKISTCAK